MKIKILIAFLLCSAYAFSQKPADSIWSGIFMPIKEYKEKYNNPLNKKDSLNIKIIQGDTLVLLENYTRPKGISIPYEYKDTTFLKQYKRIAFRHQNDSISKKTTNKYWKDDIRMFFSKSVSKNVKKEVMSLAKKISKQVDSLNIYEVKTVEDSNYIIYYFGDYEYETRMTNNKNSDYYMYWNGKNQIYNVTVKLDTYPFFSDKLQIIELKKYLFQSLGHFKLDDNLACEDYFSSCYSDNKKLSILDLELLKYHYSYGICKGTDLETFEKNHASAKKILKEHNTLIRFFHEE